MRVNSLLRKVGANCRQSSRRLVERVTVRNTPLGARAAARSFSFSVTLARLSIMPHRLPPLGLLRCLSRLDGGPLRLLRACAACWSCIVCSRLHLSSRSRNLSTSVDLPLS